MRSVLRANLTIILQEVAPMQQNPEDCQRQDISAVVRFWYKPTKNAAMKEILSHPVHTIAALCGVDVSTVHRWKARQSIPAPAYRLLRIALLGDITALGWHGWRILQGELVSTECWTFSPGEVLALMLLRQRVAHLEAERRKFLGLDDQLEATGDSIEAFNRIAGNK
jgi:hypothetical protein